MCVLVANLADIPGWFAERERPLLRVSAGQFSPSILNPKRSSVPGFVIRRLKTWAGAVLVRVSDDLLDHLAADFGQALFAS